ncbi:probable methyltransferase-like protein 24 isoform X8 [Danio rerio]|uniref:Probable methyltransferase-like protein 24 isoform X8 n=2 Tax=Danio rerio TaxID=7955 RepID=A0AC58I6S4_DANRE
MGCLLYRRRRSDSSHTSPHHRLGSSSADVVERALASSGCDVHCFDPSISSAHLQQQQHLWLHRLSVDWRDPNPAVPPHRAHSNSRKLKNILNHFGHRQVMQ